MAITLKKEVIVDRWASIIKGAQGKTESVYKDTETFLGQTQAPKVEWTRVQVNMGFLKGLFDERTFILVKNKSLPGYKMFINARDYGNNLDLSWYLTYEPNFFMSLYNATFGLLTKKQLVPDLDIFKEQDLRAYASVVHHAFLEAVDVVTAGKNIQIERKSTGFLGIS